MIQQATYAVPRADLGAAFMEYRPDAAGLIATQVFPILRTTKQAATFLKITRESLLKLIDVKRASGGAYNRLNMYAEDDSYKCEEKGAEAPVRDDQRSFYATEFDADLSAMTHIGLKVSMALEIVVKALVFNTGTFTGTALYTDNSSAPWDNIASDIIGQVIDAKEMVRKNTGMSPNTLVVGAATLANMLKNTAIRAQFPGAAVVTLAMIQSALSSIFGLTKLMVGGQVYDSAKEGQAFSGTDIWPDDYASVCLTAEENSPIDTPCVGRTFLWTPDSPEIITAEQYREEQTRSDIFRGRHDVHAKLFDAYFAHLLKIDA